MNIRKDLARKGIGAAYKAARTLGLGQIGTSLLVGAGGALGASTPYLVGGLALQVLGLKRAGALVYILGSFDMTGLEVVMLEGDKLNPDISPDNEEPRMDFDTAEPNQDLVDWYDRIVEEAYREAKG